MAGPVTVAVVCSRHEDEGFQELRAPQPLPPVRLLPSRKEHGVAEGEAGLFGDLEGRQGPIGRAGYDVEREGGVRLKAACPRRKAEGGAGGAEGPVDVGEGRAEAPPVAVQGAREELHACPEPRRQDPEDRGANGHLEPVAPDALVPQQHGEHPLVQSLPPRCRCS